VHGAHLLTWRDVEDKGKKPMKNPVKVASALLR
jgi:hypothetical protein